MLASVCFTAHCDWLAKLSSLSQPMRNETKINRDFVARLFSRAWRRSREFPSNFDWFVSLFASVSIGKSNYLGFGLAAQFKTALLAHSFICLIFKILGIV